MPDLWSGRLPGGLDPQVRQFSSSLSVDWRLAAYDIAGSLAHVAMLGHVGLITGDEANQIAGGLQNLLAEIERGHPPWDGDAEDVHSAIENELTRRIGTVAGKLHTGRSRNDQVALDLHLFLRDAVRDTGQDVVGLAAALLDQAEAAGTVAMPAYTHLQRGQPILVAHHLLAYVWMLIRDRSRLEDLGHRADSSPLGAGALAGSTLPLDPDDTRVILGLSRLYDNSLDAVSDRDFVLEYLSAASLIMVHLSRLAEDLVLWTTREFGFIEIDDGWATGSSMMPQKKNPDVLELIRGRAGRVFGDFMAVLTVMKGLPLSYNRDMQEDKPSLFDAVDTVRACLKAAAGLVCHIRWRTTALAESLTPELLATDEAETLVRQGVPFRDAHQQVAHSYRTSSPSGPIPPDQVAQSLERRDRAMGPGPQSVAQQITKARTLLKRPV